VHYNVNRKQQELKQNLSSKLSRRNFQKTNFPTEDHKRSREERELRKIIKKYESGFDSIEIEVHKMMLDTKIAQK